MTNAMDMMSQAVGGVKVGRDAQMESLSLYESLQIEDDLMALAAENDGEISEQDFELLIQAQTNSIDKIEGLCKWFRKSELFIDNCKAEKKRMDDSMKRVANRMKSAKGYIAPYVRAKKKITAGTFTLSTRKSKVVVLDEDFNDPYFITEKITKTPDKKAIKEALNAGESIIGAEIQERISLQIK